MTSILPPRTSSSSAFECGLVVPAVELLLDAPGDHAAEQIPGEGRGRGLAEQGGPPCPQVVLAESPQPFDLGDDVSFCGFAHDRTRMFEGETSSRSGYAGS